MCCPTASHTPPSASSISHALDKRVGAYSTGMRARLALARAVLHEPDLLLLDEPTAGLDPESAKAVLGLIDELAEQGKAVVMCTHLLLEAEGLADRVVVLDHGTTLVSGSPEELTHQYWPGHARPARRREPDGARRRGHLPYVREYHRNGVATVDLANVEAVPDLVDALVVRGRAPHARRAADAVARTALLRDPEPDMTTTTAIRPRTRLVRIHVRGRLRAPTCASSARPGTSGCRS